MKNSPDAQLVHNLRLGQHQALTVLYDRYAGLVYSIAHQILQNAQEAEDLTQDIFLTFWQNNSFNPDRGSVSSFLGLLTRSRAIDKIRKRTTANSFLSRWQKTITEESTDPSPLEQATTSEIQTSIHQAMQALPELQRQILNLNYYQGLSHNQIAESLDLTPGVVKSRLRQALVQLKGQLTGVDRLDID
ncbi:sigma-70 family RNA polymerase sigma factor [Chamaesiphon minutus]|uniref:RNA polymerase sigma factor, sigma-70 family n=1 Tax=Chamaesiphon minutus (strain ATCC 27169 / PCC 6605) TaxID=1173020 RepID=K9UBP6_CHAP6|nr:sigma-70 family RNA polymerase sigma factor [Chamaesiphon minutus]AFY92250.1 RNA polymerase sigma factor, sigma-70 family [Chamaesiphon minutus PCC 6605]